MPGVALHPWYPRSPDPGPEGRRAHRHPTALCNLKLEIPRLFQRGCRGGSPCAATSPFNNSPRVPAPTSFRFPTPSPAHFSVLFYVNPPRQPRRHRTRRVLKWAVPALVAALIIANAASESWHLACYRASGFELSIVARAAWFKWHDPHDPLFGGSASSYWSLGRNTNNSGSWFGSPGVTTTPHYRLVYVPLWLPTLVAALPAGILWLCDRRRLRRGLCPACGYNLSGLPPAAPCPECGKAAPP